jgi:hypothetical protein
LHQLFVWHRSALPTHWSQAQVLLNWQVSVPWQGSLLSQRLFLQKSEVMQTSSERHTLVVSQESVPHESVLTHELYAEQVLLALLHVSALQKSDTQELTELHGSLSQ